MANQNLKKSGWSKGLTKETDPRVANISKAKKGKPGKPSSRKGLTKETSSSIARVAEKLKNRIVSIYDIVVRFILKGKVDKFCEFG